MRFVQTADTSAFSALTLLIGWQEEYRLQKTSDAKALGVAVNISGWKYSPTYPKYQEWLVIENKVVNQLTQIGLKNGRRYNDVCEGCVCMYCVGTVENVNYVTVSSLTLNLRHYSC